MIDFFKQYYQTKIGRTMLLTMVLLVIPLLAINLMIIGQSRKSIQQEITQNYANALSMTVQQVSDSLYDLQQFTIALSVDDELNRMCIAEDDRENFVGYTYLRARLRSYVMQRQTKCGISIYFPKQGWIVSSEEIRSMKAPGDREALLQASNCSHWRISPAVLEPEEDCLSLATGYVHASQTSPIFFIELSRESVLGMLSTMRASRGVAQVFLLGAEGELCMEDDGRIDLEAFRQQLLSEETDADETSRQFTYLEAGRRYPAIVKALPDSDCAVGILLNEEIVSEPVNAIILWGLLSVAAFLLVVVLYMVASRRQVLRPIAEMQKAMDKVGRGDFSGVEDCYQDNEIGDVAISLNRMTQQLQQTIEEKYVSEVHLAQARMRFLRAQINPHFLYNSLFTLYTLIKNEDLDNAADLTIYLGKYYQLNTHMDGKETQLYQELEYIQLLIKIQNLRFSNRLRYEEEIDETLKMMQIPSLTLLTVVENFLTHGLKNLQGEASLKISAAHENKEAMLTVEDTGSGIDSEQLREMQRDLERARPEMDNVRGLQNVLLRLRAMYGPQARIEVGENAPHGLIVRICIPWKGREN